MHVDTLVWFKTPKGPDDFHDRVQNWWIRQFKSEANFNVERHKTWHNFSWNAVFLLEETLGPHVLHG